MVFPSISISRLRSVARASSRHFTQDAQDGVTRECLYGLAAPIPRRGQAKKALRCTVTQHDIPSGINHQYAFGRYFVIRLRVFLALSVRTFMETITRRWNPCSNTSTSSSLQTGSESGNRGEERHRENAKKRCNRRAAAPPKTSASRGATAPSVRAGRQSKKKERLKTWKQAAEKRQAHSG
jgi:hypothetical protein